MVRHRNKNKTATGAETVHHPVWNPVCPHQVAAWVDHQARAVGKRLAGSRDVAGAPLQRCAHHVVTTIQRILGRHRHTIGTVDPGIGIVEPGG